MFLRVVGTVSMEASANSPQEAAEKICDAMHGEREPKFLNLDIDDLETFIPVAYNDKKGGTKDLDVPKELVEQEFRNALVGSRLYALVKVNKDRDGMEFRPEVSLFLSERRALDQMVYEFNRAIEKADYPYISFPPIGGSYCYINENHGNSSQEWFVTGADLHTGKIGG